MKYIYVVLLSIVISQSSAQELNPRNFYFGWKLNPTDFILKNHRDHLSNEEFKALLSCAALFFDIQVDLRKSKIVAVAYSPSSTHYNNSVKSPDLPSDLSIKMSKILLDNIELTKVRSFDGTEPPDTILTFSLSLDFNVADKRKAGVVN